MKNKAKMRKQEVPGVIQVVMQLGGWVRGDDRGAPTSALRGGPF